MHNSESYSGIVGVNINVNANENWSILFVWQLRKKSKQSIMWLHKQCNVNKNLLQRKVNNPKYQS